MLAAAKGPAQIVKGLLAAGAELDAQDANGWSALMSAIEKGCVEAARELLRAGAAVDLENADGTTALMLAA